MRRSRRLPRPGIDRPTPQAVLLFDGDCAFCSSVSRWGQRRFDVEFLPYQLADLDRYGVSARLCAESVVLVSGSRVYVAGEAIARAVRCGSTGYRALASVMLAPGIRRATEAVYRVVAQNRHRLPGGTPACRMPPSPPAAGGAG